MDECLYPYCYLIFGCTDPTACNYYAGADIDDWSCVPCLIGCTDPTATDYDPAATTACNDNGTDNDCCTYAQAQSINPIDWFYPTGTSGEATDGCQSPGRWSAVTIGANDTAIVYRG